MWRGGSCSSPRVRRGKPGEDAQQRRLAGPVRAGDEQEAAVAELDVDVAKDATVAVALREPVCVDQRAGSDPCGDLRRARWKPSGAPAAANASAISSISPIQRHPFFAAERSAAASRSKSSGCDSRHSASRASLDAVVACHVADREQQRGRSLAPRGVDHLQRRRVGDEPRLDDRALEERGDVARARAREVEARVSWRCAAGGPTIPPSTNRGWSAATSRARAGEIAFASTYVPPKPRSARATSSGCVRRADREHDAAAASRTASSVTDVTQPRGTVACRLAPPDGCPDHVVPDLSASASPIAAPISPGWRSPTITGRRRARRRRTRPR